MRLVDLDQLKWPNIAIFDMNLHGECVPMVRLSDLQKLSRRVPLENVPMSQGDRSRDSGNREQEVSRGTCPRDSRKGAIE